MLDKSEHPAGARPQPPQAASAPDLSRFQHWAFICEASDCRYRGACDVREALVGEVQRRGCDTVAVVRTGCLSLCGAGPALVTYPSGDVHLHVQPQDASDLAAQLAGGAALQRRAVRAPQWYRDAILGRLGSFVQMLKRRSAAAIS